MVETKDNEKGESVNSQTSASVSTENSSISSNIKLAPFWSNSPITWFIQAEAQFQIARVVSDSRRYYHVLGALPQDVIESILDFIQSPPTTDLYPSIKNLLIERHSLSVEKRIEKLVSTENMGDRKPSDFYRALKQLAGVSNTIGDELVRKLWARRLPQTIFVALVSHSDKTISEVLPIADQIWEATQTGQVSSVSSAAPATPNVLSNLEKELNEIKKRLDNFQFQSRRFNNNSSQRSRSSNRNRSSNHSRSTSRHNSTRQSNSQQVNVSNKYCWYHKKFSSQATKCIKPCSYTESNNQKN